MSKDLQTYQAHVQSGLLLNANESSYNLDDDVLVQIQEAVMHIHYNRYPDETDTSLLEAYAKVQGLEADQLMAGNGSDQMLGFIIGYFLGKGKTLYTLQPDFTMYDYYASNYEATVKKFTVEKDGSFSIDAFIQEGKNAGANMVMFSNPNNPSGHALSVEEVVQIVTAFDDIPVVIDEAYMEFGQSSVLSLIEEYTNLYVTRTLSKAYGLAGIRLGFLATSKENMKRLRPVGVPYALNTVTQRIGTIVLEHADRFVSKIEATKARRDALYNTLKDYRSFEVYPSQANFIFGRTDKKERLLALFEQANIVIRNFQDASFRITIGTEEEIERVLDVLNQFEKENA